MKKNWSNRGGTDPTSLRKSMARLSLYVRAKQYQYFTKLFPPRAEIKILDVGTSPNTILKDTNFFEERYPFKDSLTIASIEDCLNLVKKYKLAGFIPIQPHQKFTLPDKSFDLVVSWATLEHVGSFSNQRSFVRELCRVGRKVFIVTPDKKSIYEPHLGLFFIHWLPSILLKRILVLLGKGFWAEEKNLHSLTLQDAQKIAREFKLQVKPFRLFKIFPSHLIIYRQDS